MAKTTKPLSKMNTQTMRIVNEDGDIEDVTEVGVPGLFPYHESDIEDEFQNNEAFREHMRRELE